MNVAFYAPLKPPDHPMPSGDRLIARMLWRALEAGGHEVELASRLRSFDRCGDAGRQSRIEAIGGAMAERIIARYRGRNRPPDLWLTYHLYHKAPDWLGPHVTRALGIPYCVAEASSTARHADGAWGRGHRAVTAALSAADLVVCINPKDLPGVAPLAASATRVAEVPAFVDGSPFRIAREQRQMHRAALSAQLGLDLQVPWLLSVGMMRPGDKAASFALLAEALRGLTDRPWQLIIAGDGAARPEIVEKFAAVEERCTFIGQQPASAIPALMAAADLFLWPAINEAIGMVFLEAAMAGLPVIGANRPGVAAVVRHRETGLLVAEHDADAFAAAIARLLDDVRMRRELGAHAAAYAAERHDLGIGGRQFCKLLEGLVA